MPTETTLRYTKFDFQSHKDALLARVRARFPNSWNDFLSNSFGIVLVDIVAWSTATVAFLINRVASENFIPTMTLRESAVRLGALVGYQLRGPVPATVACEATLSSPASATVTIARGTIVRTADGNSLPFEVTDDYLIEAGFTSPRTQVAVLSPQLAGSNVINSFVQVTAGSVNVDLVDTTINLSEFMQAGQSFSEVDGIDIYTIQGLESAPGAVSDFTRLVLDRPWGGETGTIAAEVFDQRILLVQGQTIVDRFVVPSASSPSFAVKLSRESVIDNSVSVTVNGEPWAAVTAVGLRNEDDQVYQVKTFVSGVTAIVFGDDRFGAAVPPEAAIEVTYRIGGGTDGNIALNTINTSITGLVSSLSGPVSVTLTNNTSSGSGGRDEETLEEARVNIPFYTRTNDRAVTLDDYQTIAQQYSSADFGSVAYARASVRTENSFLEGNNVVIYAWATGTAGGLVPLSAPMKLALKDYLQTKAMVTDYVQIFDGTDRPVPVSIRFKVFGGFGISDTRRLVLDTLRDFINALRPGQPLLYSNLVRELDEVTGLDTLNMATPLRDLIATSNTELFTAPNDDFVYDLQRGGVGSPVTDATGVQVSSYAAALPIFPIQTWSIQLFLGTNELTIVPATEAGFARLIGENLSTDDAYPSLVNLLTGSITLWLRGAPGDLTMQLVTAQGYASERIVNLFIGYSGVNTLAKRQEIRSALRAWSDGLPIGGSVYGVRVAGIAASTVSATDVVAAISGVDYVTRVALDTPGSTAVRISASDTELIRVGSISLNNTLD